MCRRVPLLCAAFWSLAVLLPVAGSEDNTLQYQYLKIYLQINTAFQLEKQGNLQGALTDYKDCYTRLQKIHNVDPNWESALVMGRMNDCRSKIVEISGKLAEQTALPTPNDEPATGNPPATSGAPASADVQALRKKLAEVEKQLKDVQEKYSSSQLEVQTLHVQLESVNQELTALKSESTGDHQMGKLLSQNKELTEKLAAAQKELASIKSPNPKGALSLLRVQLKNTQDQLAASEASNAALTQTTTTLRQQLDDAQADLRAANQKLAAAPTTSPEYQTLKRENEVMREILTRELQEQAHRDMAKRLAQEEFDRLRLTSKVLQEQLDILGSPMTPPSNDQERALLDSLRAPAAQVAAVPTESGNNFTAGTPPNGNNAPVPSGNPDNGGTNQMAAATNSTETNAPAVAESATTNGPPTTGPLTNQTVASANTNAPAVTPPSPESVTPAAPPDTNSMASATNAPGATPPAASGSNTNVAANPSTNAAPMDTNNAANAPATSDTNSVATGQPPQNSGTNAAPEMASTNAATSSTNSVASTTNAPPSDVASQFAQKPRLPEDMRDTAQQAADLFKMQRYDDAAAKYQEIIDKYPESLYAWSNLGVVRFQQGKMPEALKALQRAVSLSPTDAFSYQNLGIVYYQMGQYENAISALERALALDPNNAKSHNYLGCACSQKGWSEVAEKEFLKAIEIDDTFGDAHFNLALVYATEKPPALEMARRHYKRAIELGISPDPRLEKLLQMDGVAQNPAATAER